MPLVFYYANGTIFFMTLITTTTIADFIKSIRNSVIEFAVISTAYLICSYHYYLSLFYPMIIA